MTEVLDHGYLTLIDSWGSDEAIIEAARMSTSKGFNGWGELRCSCGATSISARGWMPELRAFTDDANTRCPTERGGAHVSLPGHDPGDEKLLRFLWSNAHATPFEMAGLTIEVKAPLMVFREWHRHRVPFGYNEMSARYTPLPDENYVPALARLFPEATRNKQAQAAAGSTHLTEAAALKWLDMLVECYAFCENTYKRGIAIGIPKELARLPVPVGRYSRMRATGNLRGWLGFLKLRCATQAQWEIRQYANLVGALVAERFPRTYAVAAESVGLS